MSKRKRRKQPQVEATPPPSVDPDGVRRAGLGAAVALLVSAPLVPADATPSMGTGVMPTMLWCLLLCAVLGAAVLKRLELKVDATTIAVVVFLSAVAVSTLSTLDGGQPRQALNATWQWVTLGIAFLVLRQLLVTAIEARALIVVMIALAAGLSAHGYFQFFYSLPEARAAYEADPEGELARVGMVAPEGSRERKLYEFRLYSKEPFATFSLTNSLAAFLAPWSLCAVGALGSMWRSERWHGKPIVVAGFFLAVIAGCLVLTKSRTSWLALLFGFTLLGVYGRSSGWRPDWRIAVVALAGVVVLTVVAAALGGVDLLVLTESVKALQFRAEYWQATVGLIADYPIFGCGVGNFQQYYTAYKLPQASETVADPHSMLFEVWATAGTVSFVAFLGIFGCALWQLRSGEENASAESPEVSTVKHIYIGAGVGLVLAIPFGLLGAYLHGSEVWLILFAVGWAFLAGWHDWVRHGQLPGNVAPIAIAVLLVNLLAAGGVATPGVGLTVWTLLAVALMPTRTFGPPPNWLQGGLLLSALGIMAVFYLSTFLPLLNATPLVLQATESMALRRWDRAEKMLIAAIESDPHADRPRYLLAATRYELWMQQPQHTAHSALFREAATALMDGNPQSASARSQCGDWWLMAFRKTGDDGYLAEAVAAYEGAMQRYPNDSLGSAQLAWAYHLSERPSAAASEAAKAIGLDELNPHEEQQLSVQHVFDPGPTGAAPAAGPGSRTAEQLMHDLRKLVTLESTEKSPGMGVE